VLAARGSGCRLHHASRLLEYSSTHCCTVDHDGTVARLRTFWSV